jgi:hypothetical protein
LPIDGAALRLPTMPPPRPSSLAVRLAGLARRALPWRRGPLQRLLLTASGVLDRQGQVWPGFADWCAAHPGTRVELLAGPDRVHSLRVPDDLPLPDDAALARYARLQFSHYFGTAAQHWPLAVDGRMACAWAEGDLDALKADAQARHVELSSLRPTWTLVPASEAQAAVIDGELLTWLRQQDGRVTDLQQRPADADLLQELGSQRPVDSRELLTRHVPRRGPDFITQPPAGRALVRAWAAAAAAACALVAVQAQGQHEEAQRLVEQAAVLDRLARPAVAAPAKAAPSNAAARTRAWAVVRQLDTDWATLWTEVERALPPGVQLLALDLDRQTLRVEGQASDADAVTRLVDRLAMQAGPDADVVLTRLQKPETGADLNSLRFELVRRAGGPR